MAGQRARRIRLVHRCLTANLRGPQREGEKGRPHKVFQINVCLAATARSNQVYSHTSVQPANPLPSDLSEREERKFCCSLNLYR